MEWVLWMIAVAILGLAAVAASGRLGEFPATVTDTPRPHVPTGALHGDDLRGLRFAVVTRGLLDAAGGRAARPRSPRQLDEPSEPEPEARTPRAWAVGARQSPGME